MSRHNSKYYQSNKKYYSVCSQTEGVAGFLWQDFQIVAIYSRNLKWGVSYQIMTNQQSDISVTMSSCFITSCKQQDKKKNKIK